MGWVLDIPMVKLGKTTLAGYIGESRKIPNKICACQESIAGF